MVNKIMDYNTNNRKAYLKRLSWELKKEKFTNNNFLFFGLVGIAILLGISLVNILK